MSEVNVILTGKLTTQQEEILEKFKEFQKAIIKKDYNKLNEIIDDKYTLTHMSGKTQTKKEFIDEIMNGTLNYYMSTTINPEITIKNSEHAQITAKTELDAMVYGMKGNWTVNTDLQMKKNDKTWLISSWIT